MTQIVNGGSRKIIRYPAVKAKTTYSRGWVWVLESRGEFPRRVAIGPNSVGWFEDEVDEWVANRPRVFVGESKLGRPEQQGGAG